MALIFLFILIWINFRKKTYRYQMFSLHSAISTSKAFSRKRRRFVANTFSKSGFIKSQSWFIAKSKVREVKNGVLRKEDEATVFSLCRFTVGHIRVTFAFGSSSRGTDTSCYFRISTYQRWLVSVKDNTECLEITDNIE